MRIGALCRTIVGACCALGCSRFSSRPPTLEYAEPSVRVDVRFSEPAFNIDFSLARDETETVLAHCRAACRVQLLPGLYRIRAYGDAPAVQRVVWLRHHTHVFVNKGSAELRSAGLGLEVSGALGLATLFVGGVAAPRQREALPHASDDGVGNLAIIGGVGAAALTFGLLLHQTSKSRMQVEEVEDVPWSSQLQPAVGAQGVGFSF